MDSVINSVKDLYVKYREIISYIFWGGLTTVVSWITYALFVWVFETVDFSGFSLFGFNIDYLNISNVLSWICAVSFAFVANKWFVFRSRSTTVKIVLFELVSFFGARIFTGVIAIVLFPILYNLGLNQSLLGTDGLPAKIVTSIIEIVLNWVFSKYLIFSHKSDKKSNVSEEETEEQ